MLIDEKSCELAAVMDTARRMCAAARTAPKARGIDHIQTMVVTGEEMEALAAEMDRLGEELGVPSFIRDAKNIRESQAVVLIGTSITQRGLDCGYCGFPSCAACRDAEATCIFDRWTRASRWARRLPSRRTTASTTASSTPRAARH